MKLISMWPKDNVDEFMTVEESSSCLTYYGSGHCWFSLSHKRAGGWKSSALHDLWITGLNRRVENENCV